MDIRLPKTESICFKCKRCRANICEYISTGTVQKWHLAEKSCNGITVYQCDMFIRDDFIPVSNKDLAKYLGINIITFSRYKKSGKLNKILKDKGIIYMIDSIDKNAQYLIDIRSLKRGHR